MQINTKKLMTRSVEIFYQNNCVKDDIVGAGDVGFDYRASQIGYSDVNGLSLLRCFLGAMLPRR